MLAAAAGGITSLACPPDTDPPLDEPGLVEMLTSSDREAAGRAQAAMMPMQKLDIAVLRAAYEGR